MSNKPGFFRQLKDTQNYSTKFLIVLFSPNSGVTPYTIRRLSFEVGVDYDTHIETAKAVIYQALKKCKSVSDKQSPTVVVTQLAESAINLRILWAIEGSTQAHTLQSLDEVISQVKTDLTEATINMPYPTKRIIMASEEKTSSTTV